MTWRRFTPGGTRLVDRARLAGAITLIFICDLAFVDLNVVSANQLIFVEEICKVPKDQNSNHIPTAFTFDEGDVAQYKTWLAELESKISSQLRERDAATARQFLTAAGFQCTPKNCHQTFYACVRSKNNQGHDWTVALGKQVYVARLDGTEYALSISRFDRGIMTNKMWHPRP